MSEITCILLPSKSMLQRRLIDMILFRPKLKWFDYASPTIFRLKIACNVSIP